MKFKNSIAFPALALAALMLLVLVSCQPGETLAPEGLAEELPAEKGQIPYKAITLVDGTLAFDSEEAFGQTLEALVAAEEEQPGGSPEGEDFPEEDFPGLAAFEAQFPGFQSQRLTIRDDIFRTEYTAENLPDAGAVKSPALLTMLDANGEVLVKGQRFGFTTEGMFAVGKGERNPLVGYEGLKTQAECCIAWRDITTYDWHSGNQLMVSNGYIYSWTFFGVINYFVKGSLTRNYLNQGYLLPRPVYLVTADPVGAFVRTGDCKEGDVNFLSIGIQRNHYNWQAFRSGYTYVVGVNSRLYNVWADHDWHWVEHEPQVRAAHRDISICQ